MSAATRVRQTTAVVQAPYDGVDLAGWLRGLTSEEYIGFTPRSGTHKSHAVVAEDGGFVFESVESLGGTKIRHRYVAKVMERDRIECISPDSRGRFLRAVPVRFETTWALSAGMLNPNTAELTCRIQVKYRNALWMWLSFLSGTPFWLRLHSNEETPRMAASIARHARRHTG